MICHGTRKFLSRSSLDCELCLNIRPALLGPTSFLRFRHDSHTQCTNRDQPSPSSAFPEPEMLKEQRTRDICGVSLPDQDTGRATLGLLTPDVVPIYLTNALRQRHRPQYMP